MATDAIVVLHRLSCTRESDVSGGSEPYIWPVLVWIDDNTLATPDLVGATGLVVGNARVVIKSGMRAGETADIPASVGVLRVRLEDDLETRQLILVVALWEKDETPTAAMRAGFQAFSSELRAAIADNLFNLALAESDSARNQIIAIINARVRTRVTSAIEDGLTGWQKARVLVGTLNLDDIIDSAFERYPELVSSPINLSLTAGTSQEYAIEGELQTRPVRVDVCQAEVDAVKDAKATVDAIDAAIKVLQAELQGAAPGEKPFIISEIQRLREEDLPIAMSAVEEARFALNLCRLRKPADVSTGGLLVTEAGAASAETSSNDNDRADSGGVVEG